MNKGIVLGIVILFITLAVTPTIYGNSISNFPRIKVKSSNPGEKIIFDIVTCNYDYNVVVYLGNGDGTFGNRQDYYIGKTPFNVKAGDFNNDNNLDIVVLNLKTENVSFLYGYGNGSFAPPIKYYMGFIPSIDCLVYDYNKDENTDIAFINYHYRNVTILLGNGDGTFKFHQDIPVGRLPITGEIGDFNNDQNIDLAVLNRDSKNISMLFGNGDGTFDYGVDLDGRENTYDINTGDFNNDNNIDMVVSTPGSKVVTFFVGNGTGRFDKLEKNTAGGRDIVTGDFNLDGYLDFGLVREWQDSVEIHLGDGNFSFSTLIFTVGGGPAGIISKDFNRDDIPDLAIAERDEDAISIYLGNGDGTFGNITSYPVGRCPVYLIAERFRNQPPTAPTIAGPHGGKPGESLTFTFNAVDPEDYDVRFIIDWGDEQNETTSFTGSGTDKTASHAWSEEGTYILSVKAEDEYGAIGDETWGEIVIKKKGKSINRPMFQFFQNHPNLFPILQQILARCGV
jgi:hypothetical protein